MTHDGPVKSDEEIMEIARPMTSPAATAGAAELSGYGHHTMPRYVQLRGHGVDLGSACFRGRLVSLVPGVSGEVMGACGSALRSKLWAPVSRARSGGRRRSWKPSDVLEYRVGQVRDVSIRALPRFS